MAAAARYGTLFIRFDNGAQQALDAYISDVANANGNFDNGSGVASSTSADNYIFPANGTIYDFSVASGLTDTTAGQVTANGVATGTTLRWANHLNTLNNRPALNIRFRQGSVLRIIQKA